MAVRVRLQLTTSEEWRQVLKPEKVEIIIKMTRNSINKLSASLVGQQANGDPPLLLPLLPLHFVTPPTSLRGCRRTAGGRAVEAKWFATTPATVGL